LSVTKKIIFILFLLKLDRREKRRWFAQRVAYCFDHVPSWANTAGQVM